MTKKLVVVIVSVIIVLALAGGVTWLFMSGKLAWAGNGVQPSGVKIVCGEDVVTRYNQATLYIAREGATELTRDTQGVQDIATEVRGKDGYEDDATCQTLLFGAAVSDGDVAKAQTAYNAIVSLHERALYADNNLSGIGPLDQYQQTITQMAARDSSQRGTSEQ